MKAKTVKMFQFLQRILDWFKSLFWKEEMELTLVGLQYSGKTTFVNVIAVSAIIVGLFFSPHPPKLISYQIFCLDRYLIH